MSVHEQFADDLSLYALGALQGEERLTVEKHLKDCPDCRHELSQLQGDLTLLALSASGPKPPLRSRERLMAAIAKEPRRTRVRLVKRKTWWTALEWAAAAATVTVILLLLRQNTDLRQRVAALEANSAGQHERLLQAKELIATLTSADAVHFTLVAGKTPPQPQGKAIYVRSTSTLVFLASNMPELPLQKTYELWLIPTSGAPIPAGLFRPDTHGSAALIKPPLPAGIEAKTFAITVEPGPGSAAPTSTPIMVGIGG
jgi:anti-sigma-K factor RskA